MVSDLLANGQPRWGGGDGCVTDAPHVSLSPQKPSMCEDSSPKKHVCMNGAGKSSLYPGTCGWHGMVWRVVHAGAPPTVQRTRPMPPRSVCNSDLIALMQAVHASSAHKCCQGKAVPRLNGPCGPAIVKRAVASEFVGVRAGRLPAGWQAGRQAASVEGMLSRLEKPH